MRSCCGCPIASGIFRNTVRYCSPSHGGWGIVRTAMLVPECHQLFVSPFACGRHGALGALVQGFKDRLSYLYIDEADIVSGGYEELIPEAVDRLLERLVKEPRALMIVVSCLDDLLCTDHEAFLAVIRERHPGLRVGIGHMNPISLDGNVPPAVNIQRSMYGLLKRSDEPSIPGTAAFYGNNVPLDEEGEIFEVLRTSGFHDVRHISGCSGFDDFDELSRMSLNLVPTPTGRLAAKDAERALGIDSEYVPVSYDFDEIDECYGRLLSRSGRSMDLGDYRREAQRSLDETVNRLDGLPVVVDASATVRPFCLARTLLMNGFKVETVYAQKCIPLDRPYLEWISEKFPDTEVLQPEHHRSPIAREAESFRLAVGFEGAYLSGARYVANVANDETLYGYHGVSKLADMMARAVERPTDLRALLDDYGIVV